MPELKFDSEKHRYYLDEKKILGVNEIIQLAGLSSYKGITDGRLNDARIKGNYIHKGTSLLDQGTLDLNTIDEAIRPYIECWKMFVHGNGVEMLHNETKMYSQKLMIAGTMDRICKFENKLWVLDIKTGEEIKPETRLQLAAYQIIANEYLKINIKSRIVVRLTKTIPHIEKYGDESDQYDFMAVLRCVRWSLKYGMTKEI